MMNWMVALEKGYGDQIVNGLSAQSPGGTAVLTDLVEDSVPMLIVTIHVVSLLMCAIKNYRVT